MSAKLRDEIEAKRAKLQELRQARLNRQRNDIERRTPGSVSRQPHGPIAHLAQILLDTQAHTTVRCKRATGIDSGSGRCYHPS
jgi:hypothetical protein